MCGLVAKSDEEPIPGRQPGALSAKAASDGGCLRVKRLIRKRVRSGSISGEFLQDLVQLTAVLDEVDRFHRAFVERVEGDAFQVR